VRDFPQAHFSSSVSSATFAHDSRGPAFVDKPLLGGASRTLQDGTDSFLIAPSPHFPTRKRLLVRLFVAPLTTEAVSPSVRPFKPSCQGHLLPIRRRNSPQTHISHTCQSHNRSPGCELRLVVCCIIYPNVHWQLSTCALVGKEMLAVVRCGAGRAFQRELQS